MVNNHELVDDFFEIKELDQDQFLKVKETLTRIGISSKKKIDNKPILYQSCHVLHKRGRYYIVHFKQLFQLDGRMEVTDFSDEDYDRTEFVVCLLEEWGLIESLVELEKPNVKITVIPYREKRNWNLQSKYTIGIKHYD